MSRKFALKQSFFGLAILSENLTVESNDAWFGHPQDIYLDLH
jgi:hypothetical protein